MARARQDVRSAIVRGGSTTLEMIGDATAAEIDGETVTIEMAIGLRSVGGDRGRVRGIVSTIANTRTDIGHGRVPKSTEDTVREAANVGAMRTATKSLGTTNMDARRAQDVMRGVATTTGAAADRRISTQDHAEVVSIESTVTKGFLLRHCIYSSGNRISLPLLLSKPSPDPLPCRAFMSALVWRSLGSPSCMRPCVAEGHESQISQSDRPRMEWL
jgi:hypothetical protein